MFPSSHEFREGARTTIGVEMTSKRVDVAWCYGATYLWDTAGRASLHHYHITMYAAELDCDVNVRKRDENVLPASKRRVVCLRRDESSVVRAAEALDGRS